MRDDENIRFPSEGAEWETGVVALLLNGKLPTGYIEKTPIKLPLFTKLPN